MIIFIKEKLGSCKIVEIIFFYEIEVKYFL